MADDTARERHGKSLNYVYSRVPYIQHLGLELLAWDVPDTVVVKMPYSSVIDNSGGTAHGGAIASLIDSAGSSAAWNGHDYDKGVRGATVTLTVNFVGAAKDEAIVATAHCVRRARELCFVEVTAVSEISQRIVATGSIIYRIAP